MERRVKLTFHARCGAGEKLADIKGLPIAINYLKGLVPILVNTHYIEL